MQPFEQDRLDAASPGGEPARTGESNDQASLPALLAQIRSRYDRPALDESRDDMVREAIAIAGSGLDIGAAIACAAICASACSDCGPGLVYGPWALSATLRMVGQERDDTAGSAVARDLADAGRASAEFLDWLAGEDRDIPTLLLAAGADASFMHELARGSPDLALHLHPLDERTSVVFAASREDAGSIAPWDQTEPLFSPPGIDERRAAIRLVVSRLWRAAAIAVATEVDMDGFATAIPDTVPDVDRQVLSTLLASAWPRLLPDLATASLALPVSLESREELENLWLSVLSPAAKRSALHAVRSQAALVWQLAMITCMNPTAGYRGLLVTADETTLAGCMKAARDAGVILEDVKPGDDSRVAWQLGQRDGRFVLCCPPAGASAATAQIGQTEANLDDARIVNIRDERFLLAAPGGESGAALTLLPSDEYHPAAAGPTEVSGTVPTVPVDAGGWRMAVSKRLLDESPPFVVEVVVELAGDRDADVATIAAVHALMDRHNGPVKARLVLVRSAFKRVVERGPAHGVSYTAALEDEVKQLLGADSITLRLDVPVGSS